jgi:hypothetical protein
MEGMAVIHGCPSSTVALPQLIPRATFNWLNVPQKVIFSNTYKTQISRATLICGTRG